MPSNDLSFMRTASKKDFVIENPDPSLMDIEDIAHALSMLCRFGGNIPYFYSVAQHSVLVSELCDPKDAFWGLMHDTAEAFTGDIISPVKVLLKDFKKVEKYFMSAICERFKLDPKMPASVKRADMDAYMLEEDNLRKNNFWPSNRIPEWAKKRDPIMPLPPWFAKELFLERFKELTK